MIDNFGHSLMLVASLMFLACFVFLIEVWMGKKTTSRIKPNMTVARDWDTKYDTTSFEASSGR